MHVGGQGIWLVLPTSKSVVRVSLLTTGGDKIAGQHGCLNVGIKPMRLSPDGDGGEGAVEEVVLEDQGRHT